MSTKYCYWFSAEKGVWFRGSYTVWVVFLLPFSCCSIRNIDLPNTINWTIVYFFSYVLPSHHIPIANHLKSNYNSVNGTHSSEIETQTFAQRIYTGQFKKINMLDIKGSADYLSRSTGSFSNFSMLFAGNNTDFLTNLNFFFFFHTSLCQPLQKC